MAKRNVEFKSCGVTCKGILITPDRGTGPFPIAIMAGGWCYVKEIVMPHYAKPIVDAGIACLLFDYRNMGDSGGDRRQHIDPWMQVEDYKNAITFASRLPEIDPDRIAAWGISYSGGHVMIVGATDPRVKAICSTVAVVEGWETMQRSHGAHGFEDVERLIMEDRLRRYEGHPGGMLPFSGYPHEGLATWPFGHAREVFMKLQKTEAPNHRHESTIESLENLLMYDARPYAKRIFNIPTIMVVAAEDHYTQWDMEIAMFNSIPTVEKRLVVLKKVDHLSLYSSRDNLAIAAGEHAAHLKKYLIDGYVKPAQAHPKAAE